MLNLLLVFVLVAGFVSLTASAAQAQEQTGATATKECPTAPVNDPYTIGDTVSCTATFTNDGAFPATVTELIETAPFVVSGSPGNGAPIDIECMIGTTVINEGDTLPPATVCTANFGVTIPNDPALCNTVFRDRVNIALAYPQFTPPLEAGAFATHTVLVFCAPSITVSKVADELSKVGDPVNYTIEVCNTGLITVARQSVVDSLLGNISASFAATLAPGACDEATVSRTVLAGDPDPLLNTVTATYTAGLQTATASASDSTNLFQPSVGVTKSCVPSPNEVGGVSTCTIVVTNTSSSDSPNLENGTIMDTLTGNLLDPANTAVTSSDCTAVLPVGDSCTIVTARTILAGDPNPVVNTVTVHYNPVGFPNDITASATASVTLVSPMITVTKEASPLSKVGDDVTYTIEICNAGVFPVTRTSVSDTLLGNISGSFAASLAPGQCSSATLTRTVLAGDSDPLMNTVTATYSGAGAQATASASATTNLFQPSVGVTKSCTPDPITVGAAELCTIVVTNTSSADSPDLVNGSIMDTLTGNLLDPANTAVTSSDCAPVLPTDGSCQIVTSRIVLASDPTPLENTVTVTYNPDGFPNVITDTASDSVVQTLSIGGVIPVCVRDAPFIEFTFGEQTQLNGHVGTLSFFDINGNLIEVRPLTYQAGATIREIYPGATVDADGNAIDWPGWVLNEDGFWVPDPTDAIWRDGLNLVLEINPTATAFVAYPPATSACASPTGPFPPPTSARPPLAATGGSASLTSLALGLLGAGALCLATERRLRRWTGRSTTS